MPTDRLRPPTVTGNADPLSTRRLEMMRRGSLMLPVVFGVVALSLLGPGWSGADDSNGAVRMLATVPIPGTLAPLRAFDISFIAKDSQLYYLADRSNASVDVVNTRTNTFVGQIKANPPFAGVAVKPGPV